MSTSQQYESIGNKKLWPGPGMDKTWKVPLIWVGIEFKSQKNSGIYPMLYTYTYNTVHVLIMYENMMHAKSAMNENESIMCLSPRRKGSNRFIGVGTAPWSPSETHSLPVDEFNSAVFVALSYQLFISVSLWELRVQYTDKCSLSK